MNYLMLKEETKQNKFLNGEIELFIAFESINIFYLNLGNPLLEPKIDVQLISGFLSANNIFFNELNLSQSSDTLRILRGKHELRMITGKNSRIHATLILKNLTELDLKAYYELDVLIRSIIHEFESKYIKEIENFIKYGEIGFKGIEKFIKEEVNKMKAHIYTSYLMHILGKSINRNVRKEESKELLISLNRMYSDLPLNYDIIRKHHDMIKSTIINYQKAHTTVNKIIKIVNRDSKQIWVLFLTPIIQILKSN